MIRRFLMWMGYIPTWFTEEEFEQKVGRLPCVECHRLNQGFLHLILCDYDIDAWFDAVLA
jgi:hypothetical protein